MKLINIIKLFSALAFLSFLSSVWNDDYKEKLIQTGGVFAVSAIVLLIILIFALIFNVEEDVKKW